MENYRHWTLDNGLQVIFLPSPGRTMATVNVLYNVGARDEDENHTGFAHLFEHLMFSGSKHIPSYDSVVENAGGKNNAYTNNDITNYYITLPLFNLETALWLESDRMQWLNINEDSLNVQRGVVVEEFKQRCYNAPFGMLWHHARQMLFEKHPYRWPTIGLNFEHIEQSTLKDVQDFYNKYYNPNNAILGIAADIDVNKAKKLVDKWFGELENKNEPNANKYTMESSLVKHQILKETDIGANNSILLFWRMSGEHTEEMRHTYAFTSILGEEDGGYLVEKCVKQSDVFSSASIFTSASADYSFTLLYGILNPDKSYEEGKDLLLSTLNTAIDDKVITAHELQANINTYFYNLEVSKLGPAHNIEELCKAQNAGGIHLIKEEENAVKNFNLETIYSTAKRVLNKENMCEIHYSPKKNDIK